MLGLEFEALGARPEEHFADLHPVRDLHARPRRQNTPLQASVQVECREGRCGHLIASKQPLEIIARHEPGVAVVDFGWQNLEHAYGYVTAQPSLPSSPHHSRPHRSLSEPAQVDVVQIEHDAPRHFVQTSQTQTGSGFEFLVQGVGFRVEGPGLSVSSFGLRAWLTSHSQRKLRVLRV